MAISFEAFPPTRPTRLYSSKMPGICTVRDFTIRSNTNGLGLRLNVIKDLCPSSFTNWSLDGLVRHTVRQVVSKPGHRFESLRAALWEKDCEGFHNSLQYQWTWFAIECYKRFVPPHPSPIDRWMDQ